jgi:hypothetical protein
VSIFKSKVPAIKFLSATTLFLLTAIFLLSSGCAVNRATATVDPKTDLSKIKTLSVIPYEPAASEIALLIERKLKSMGYQVTTGQNTQTEVDAIVTFKDKWMWDITTYMIELTIVIREPKTEYPLATGNSFHTSLTRKSPAEMVEEVLNNIFRREK